MNNSIVKSSVHKKERYPIKVCCVVDNLSKNNKTIEQIREYSNSLNIEIDIREYNSRKYSDDRIFIEGLPGFHIYEENIYKNTIHNSADIYQNIKGFIDNYKKRVSIKEKNRERWREIFKKFRFY
jgi:hypothetical protein